MSDATDAPSEPTYKVICMSLYTDDLARLDAIVEELKKRGVRKVSRSSVIRDALDRFDTRKVGRSLR